jgi:hypothetical protein
LKLYAGALFGIVIALETAKGFITIAAAESATASTLTVVLRFILRTGARFAEPVVIVASDAALRHCNAWKRNGEQCEDGEFQN